MTVRVMATVGIMWGFLQVVCNGIGLAPYLVANSDNPMMATLHSHPNLFAVLLTVAVSRAALAMVLMVGSVIALMLKPFGRQAMLVFAVGTILVTLAEVAVALSYPEGLMPPPAADGQTLAPQRPHGLLLAFGMLAPLIFPVLVLFFMNQRHVKAAFKRGG